MANSDSSRGDVHLRDVEDDDLEVFFEQQRDPEAIRRAAFPARERDAFMAKPENAAVKDRYEAHLASQ